jgi:hypothetical protein
MDAVDEAAKIGADIEKSVCKNKEHECGFYAQCEIQRQKKLTASADLVIAAHNILERKLPKFVEKDLWLIIIDETFAPILIRDGDFIPLRRSIRAWTSILYYDGRPSK